MFIQYEVRKSSAIEIIKMNRKLASMHIDVIMSDHVITPAFIPSKLPPLLIWLILPVDSSTMWFLVSKSVILTNLVWFIQPGVFMFLCVVLCEKNIFFKLGSHG